MTHTSLALLAAIALGYGGAVDAAEPPGRIHCQVTHSISCSKDVCQKDAEENAHIELVMTLPGGDGNLCTATYCRDIRWMKLVGGNGPQTFGAVHSSASGSTRDKLDTPVVDFYLWIGPERRDFSLIPIDGYGSTWAGVCSPLPVDR